MTRVDTPNGTVVVASAISKKKHDEAHRELLLQLAIADLASGRVRATFFSEPSSNPDRMPRVRRRQ